MGILHKAVPMTVGLCVGVASKIEGTIAWDIVQRSPPKMNSDNDIDLVRLGIQAAWSMSVPNLMMMEL